MTENTNDTPRTGTDTATTETETAPRRSRLRRPLLIGGIALGAVALVGGGVAIGAAIDDDDDDDDRAAVSFSQTSVTTDGGSTEGTGTGTAQRPAPTATDSADDLLDAIATAADQAEGEPVGIEGTREGGWKVDFETAAGDETEVTVASDGAATVTATERADADDADSAPAGMLDAATVRALLDPAFADADGEVTELAVDGDPTSPYDVTVVTGATSSVDLELDADFVVVERDTDD
jgi:hypothetical protein